MGNQERYITDGDIQGCGQYEDAVKEWINFLNEAHHGNGTTKPENTGSNGVNVSYNFPVLLNPDQEIVLIDVSQM